MPEEEHDFFGPQYPAAADLLLQDQTARDVKDIVAYVESRTPGDGRRLLDAPCGYGRLSIPLAQHGFRVSGCDRSLPLIEDARARASEAGLAADAFAQVDLTTGPPASGAFDYVVCWHHSLGYGPPDDDVAIVRHLLDCLDDAGQLLIQLLNVTAVVRHLDDDASATFRADDGNVEIHDRVVLDLRTSVLSTQRVSATQHGPGAEAHLTTRLYSASELDDCVRRAGGQLAAVRGDGFAPLSIDSRHMIGVVCRD